MPTIKHNMRIPDEIWDPATDKAGRLADLGYRGANGPYSVTVLCRDSLRQAGEESDERTALRLGLVRAADSDRHMTSAEAAS